METVMLVSIMLIPILMVIIWWNDITNNIGKLFRTITNTITSSYNNIIEHIKDRLLSVNRISKWYERYQINKAIKPYRKNYTNEEWKVVEQLFLNQAKQFKQQETTLPHMGTMPLGIMSLEQVLRITDKICHKLLETDGLFKVVPMVGPVGAMNMEGTEDLITHEAMFKKIGTMEASKFQDDIFIDEVENAIANMIHSEYLKDLFGFINQKSSAEEPVKYHDKFNITDNDIKEITKAEVGKDEILISEIVPTIEKLFSKYQYLNPNAVVISDYEIAAEIISNDNFIKSESNSTAHIRKIGNLKMTNGRKIDIYQDFGLISKIDSESETNMYLMCSESSFVDLKKNTLPTVSNNVSATIMPYVPFICSGPLDTDNGEPTIGIGTRFACMSFINNIISIPLEKVDHAIENKQESTR